VKVSYSRRKTPEDKTRKERVEEICENLLLYKNKLS
jgi:hypothetical protein